MGFIDSYKHLEKLCGDLLNDERRLSAYIDEMVHTSRGAYFVSGWDADLKKLKQYRWIRNQIVHEVNCSEENMCSSDDALWLDDFYRRIINQTDPLALYAKAIKNCNTSKTAQSYNERPTYRNSSQPDNGKNDSIYGLCIVLIIIICVVILVAKNI